MSEMPVPHKWREEPQPNDSVDGQRSRRSRIQQFFLAIFLVLLGLLGLLYMLRPVPQSTQVTLRTSGPPSLIPQWWPDQNSDPGPQINLDTSMKGRLASGVLLDSQSFQERLLELASLDVSGTVIVTVTAPARISEQGDVQILSIDADPINPETWIPLSLLFESANQCQADHVLLILDIFEPLASLVSGVLVDEVSDRIQAEREATGLKENVFILTSCAGGQVSSILGQDSRPVFANAVSRGLNGQADVDPISGNSDGVVSLQELTTYVSSQVDRWTQRFGAPIQTPLLYGEGDFSIVAANARLLEENEPASGPQDPYPDELREAWARRDQLRKREIDHLAPLSFRRWESALLSAEQAWLLGESSERFQQNLQIIKEEYEDRLKKLVTLSDKGAPNPRSLALAEYLGLVPGEQAKKALQAFQSSVNSSLQSTPESQGSNGLGPGTEAVSNQTNPSNATSSEENRRRNGPGENKSPPDVPSNQETVQPSSDINSDGPMESDAPDPWTDVLQAIDKIPALDASWLAVNSTLSANKLQLESVQKLDNTLRARLGTLATVEAVKLSELARSTTSSGQVQDLLKGVSRAEAVQARPEAFPWLGNLLREAALARHEADFFGRAPGFGRSDLATVQRLTRSSLIVRQVEEALELVRLRNKALRLLPDIATYLEHGPRLMVAYSASREESIPPLYDTWRIAVEETQTLDGLLSPFLGPKPSVVPDSNTDPLALTQARRHAAALEEALEDLRRPFGVDLIDWLLDLTQSGTSKRPNRTVVEPLSEIHALLTTPILSADFRVRLCEARRELLMTHLAIPVTTATPPGFPQSPALRAALSIDLLSIGSADQHRIDALRSSLDGAPIVQTGQQEWVNLGLDLRKAWEDVIKPGPIEDLVASDRLSRILPTGLIQEYSSGVDVEPALQLRSRRWSALRQWHTALFQAQASDIGSLPPDVLVFYRSAAEAYQTDSDWINRHRVAVVLSDNLSSQREQLGPGASLNIRIAGGRAIEPETLQVRIFGAGGSSSPVVPVSDDIEGAKELNDRSGSGLALEVRSPQFIQVPLAARGRGAGREKASPSVVALVTYENWTYGRIIPIGEAASTNSLTVLIGPVDGPPSEVGRLRIRPTSRPQLYKLFVRNDGTKARNVKGVLSVGNKPFASINIDTMAPGETREVLIPTAENSTGQGSGNSTDDSGTSNSGSSNADGSVPEPTVLVDQPIIIMLEDKDEPNVSNSTYRLSPTVDAPVDYVRLMEGISSQVSPGVYRIDLALKARRLLFLPSCPVVPTLPPERNPYLIVESGDSPPPADDPPELPPDGQSLPLAINGIELNRLSDVNGELSLEIDGVNRALIYRVGFHSGGEPTRLKPITEQRLRVVAPDRVSAGSPLSVTIEVDNGPPTANLEVGFGQSHGGSEIQLRRLDSPRKRTVSLSAGPNGTLSLMGKLTDWTVELPTGGQDGRRYVWARLVGEDGSQLAFDSKSVLVDGRAPKGLAFLDVPGEVLAGTSIVLQATGRDDETGISKVVFYLGQPSPDGSAPEGATPVKGSLVPGAIPAWQGELPLPKNRLGPVPVSATFTDGVGRARSITQEVVVTSELAKQLAAIRGRVIHGNRPQPNLTVQLLDTEGKSLNETSTDQNGRFMFKDLEPKTYLIRATRASSSDRAGAQVELTAGQTKSVTLKLTRLGPLPQSGATEP